MMYLLYGLLCIWSTSLCADNSTYDVIVIGAGPTGIIAAQAAANFGRRVAIVEQETITRNRISQGDIPLKALIKASHVAHIIRDGAAFGLTATDISSPAHDTLKYIQQVIQKAGTLYDTQLKELNNIAFIYGHATFIDAHTIQVNEARYTADRFIIATGGHPYIPPIKGLETTPYYTKDTLFSLSKLPASIIIVGQGPLGVELATALHRLGVQVTFLVKHGLILPNYDFELVELEYNQLKAAGIKVHCGATVTEVKYDGSMIQLNYQTQLQKEASCTAQALLIALDLIGNTAGLGLEDIGVEVAHDGIVVDDTMKSSIDSIYACGDVVGRMYTLTRVAYYQAHIAAFNCCKPFYGKPQHANYTNVSSFIQGILPLGSIGLSEQAARKKYGKSITIYHHAYSDSARAIIDNATDGFVKCICLDDGTLVGVHVVGEGADQIIDSVRMGKSFDQQFAQYVHELRTSPNYLDVIWQTAMQSARDHPQSLLKLCKKYLITKLQGLLGLFL
jgi:pyruvate/2-oxoglutarate dehydrogenase complex dihydrolipoamide dehydrogenase (E3) component